MQSMHSVNRCLCTCGKMESSDFESESDCSAVSMTSDFGQPSIAESTIPESSYDASTSAEFCFQE